MYKKHILIHGLSADPVHQAHVDLVVDVAQALAGRDYIITKVMIIPVYRRNLPKENKLSDTFEQRFPHRFAICELAAKEISQRLSALKIPIEVSKMEENLAKPRMEPNHTIETLETLRSETDMDTGFIFIASSDIFSGELPEFGRWQEPERLVQLASIAICPRPGFKRNDDFLKSFENKGADFIYLDELPQKDVAASQIKERLLKGEDPLALSKEGLLPESIALYIKEHNMYKG